MSKKKPKKTDRDRLSEVLRDLEKRETADIPKEYGDKEKPRPSKPRERSTP